MLLESLNIPLKTRITDNYNFISWRVEMQYRVIPHTISYSGEYYNDNIRIHSVGLLICCMITDNIFALGK